MPPTGGLSWIPQCDILLCGNYTTGQNFYSSKCNDFYFVKQVNHTAVFILESGLNKKLSENNANSKAIVSQINLFQRL